MERSFICVRSTPDTFHSSVFCGISLFSFVAISPHTFTVLSLPFSLPLSLGLLLTYALSSLIFHCCCFTLGTRTWKENVNCCHHVQGVGKDVNLLDQERWEWRRGGWLQAVFKGLERKRLKLDFLFYVFLRQQHSRPLKVIWACNAVLCGVVQLLFFFKGTLNSCFGCYFTVLLPWSPDCHGLVSKLFHLCSNAKSH